MNVCLWSPGWSTAGASAADAAPSTHELATSLAGLAPRLRVERELIWADGQGLDAVALAGRLLERVAEEGVVCRAGVAAVPVTAELAARWGGEEESSEATTFLVKERTGWGRRAPSAPSSATAGRSPGPASPGSPGPVSPGSPGPVSPGSPGPVSPGPDGGGRAAVVVVDRGGERAWQAGLPVLALQPDDRLRSLLEGVGIRTVGALASLDREAVEVRFGGGAVSLWRRARADDRRLLFDRIPPERPHGSMDFVDYVLTDPSRLLFTANALLGPICDGLTGRGEHARTLRLELPLANGETWDRTLRPARPTASRETWLRMIRALLDRLTVPDAVAGMRLEVPSTEAAGVRQGDLFDRGFATASAVEAAVARLAEREVWPVVPESDGHPLVERRGKWRRQPVSRSSSRSSPSSSSRSSPSSAPGSRGLTLQLLPEPRRIRIETTLRRDHEVPVRLRDRRGWRDVLLASGPDRISGGRWEASSYAREYYRCITEEGVPLWIYRDALDGAWYLHGWWD